MSNNDPVYPIPGGGAVHIGLTKLEYFAGLAMQGLLANSYSNGANQPLSEASRHEISELAVDQAKSLIKRLEQVGP
jgi:hypothetical protein